MGTNQSCYFYVCISCMGSGYGSFEIQLLWLRKGSWQKLLATRTLKFKHQVLNSSLRKVQDFMVVVLVPEIQMLFLTQM